MPGTVAEPPSPAPPAPARGVRGARPKVLVAVLAGAVAAAIGFVAFGGSASTVIDPDAQAAKRSSSVAGYRMRLSMQLVPSTGSAPTTMTGAGSFDVRDHAGSISMAMNLGNDPQVIQALGSNTLRMQEIVDGTTVYVKLPAAAAGALPTSGKPWIALDLSKVTGIPGLSSLAGNPGSSDPSEMLQWLRGVSDSILAEGQQQVDGVQTTHYRAQLSLDRSANAVPAAERAAVQQAMSKLEQLTQVHEIPVDVWVDAHHLVRRFEMNFTASLPGGSTVSEVVTIDITHYGPERRPAVPPASEVTDLSSLLSSGA
jgi:hypothetical protein